jgi:hypothetical protein
LLVNQLGQIVQSIFLTDAALAAYQMELAGLQNGQYTLLFRAEGQLPIVKKLILNQ